MIGVVCGLRLEAALIPTEGPWRVACDGPGPAAAESAARRLLAQGCQALVSFGTAGGLIPDARPGTLVLASAVIDATTGEVFATTRALLPEGCSGVAALLAGSSAPLLTPQAKRDLATRTGAMAVDMESHAVGRVAREAALAFAVARAIADPSDRAIPGWALAGVDEQGRTRMAPILRALARDPRRLGSLFQLASEAQKARHSLSAIFG